MSSTIETEPQRNHHKVVRSSSIAIVGRVLGRGLGYISQIILARILAPDSYGLFAIGWTILRLFSIAGHLGLDYGITKFGAFYWGKDFSKLRSLIILSVGSAFLSGLVFGLILNLSAPWLAESVFKKPDLEQILKGIAIVFPFATTLRVLAAIIVLQGKTLYGAISEDITQPIIQIVLFATWLKVYGGITAAIFSTIISYSIAVAIGLIFIAHLLPDVFSMNKIGAHDLMPLFRYSVPAIVGATLGAFNLWGDRLLVGYFGTKSDAGIYQSISLITMLTTTVLSGIKISSAPTLARLYHEKRHSDLEYLIKSTARWGLYITMPVLLFISMNTSDVVQIFFGKEYLSGALPLLILTIGQVFYVTFAVIDQTLLMTGKQKTWLVISIIAFILTISFDAYFIPKLSLLGASIVSSTILLFIGISSIVYLKRHLNFWLIDSTHIRILITTLIAGLATQLIKLQLSTGAATNTLLGFIITVMLFIFFLVIFGMDKEDRTLLIKFLKAGNSKRSTSK